MLMRGGRRSFGSRVFRDDLLKGKVALVSGGGTGIGAACALELAHLGAKVIIASRRAENYMPAAAGLRKLSSSDVIGVPLDIRDRDSVRTTVDALVREHGAIDVLVNNGGGQYMTQAEHISDKGWDAVLETNLTGTWNLTRACADASMLRGRGGRVINVTMLTATAFPGMAHSHAARAGVEALTRTLAVEWASAGVRVNCVAPGIVASSGLRRYPRALGVVQRARGAVPVKRLASCEEIAWLVAYLAGPGGDYVTGETIAVDGGHRLWGLGGRTWPIADPADPPAEIPPEPWRAAAGESSTMTGVLGGALIRALEAMRAGVSAASSRAFERTFKLALRRRK